MHVWGVCVHAQIAPLNHVILCHLLLKYSTMYNQWSRLINLWLFLSDHSCINNTMLAEVAICFHWYSHDHLIRLSYDTSMNFTMKSVSQLYTSNITTIYQRKDTGLLLGYRSSLPIYVVCEGCSNDLLGKGLIEKINRNSRNHARASLYMTHT